MREGKNGDAYAVGSAVGHGNLHIVVGLAGDRDVGLDSFAGSNVDNRCRRKVRSVREERRGEAEEFLIARHRLEITVKLFLRTEFVSSGAKLPETKLTVDPGAEGAGLLPVLLAFANFATKKKQMKSQDAGQCGGADFADDESLRFEIDGYGLFGGSLGIEGS